MPYTTDISVFHKISNNYLKESIAVVNVLFYEKAFL